MSKHEPYPEWLPIAHRIRQARLDQGLTQGDVREATGMQMGPVEIGIQRLNGLQMVQLADYLGVSVGYLLTGVAPEEEHLFIMRENYSLRRQVARLETILDTIANYAKTGEIRQRSKKHASLPKL